MSGQPRKSASPILALLAYQYCSDPRTEFLRMIKIDKLNKLLRPVPPIGAIGALAPPPVNRPPPQ